MDNYWLECLVTIIIGCVVGILFGYILIPTNSYIGPDSNEVRIQIITDDNGKKYKWEPQICICPINYSMTILKDPVLIEENKIKH